MRVFFGIAVILILASTGSYARKCYHCKGEGNICKSGSRTCPRHFDRCMKFVATAYNGDQRVAAVCSNRARCDRAEATCKEIVDGSTTIEKCEAYCCTGDNCNLSPKTSQVILAVLVLGLLAATLLN